MLSRLRMDFARRMVRLGLLASAAAQQQGTPPDLSGTVTFELPFGTIALPAEDEVIVPAIASIGSWDPGGTAYLGRHLRPGMTVLDVDAHVGYHAVHAGRLVGPTGLVLTFEPEPRNFRLLLANVWRNGLGNVVCFPWAVSDTTGFAPLYLGDTNTGDHRLADDGGRDSVVVRTVRLDDTLVVRPPVDLVTPRFSTTAQAPACRSRARADRATTPAEAQVSSSPAMRRRASQIPAAPSATR